VLNNTKTQSRPKLFFLVPAISQTHKSLENSQDFFCQDQDQDFYIKTKTKTKTLGLKTKTKTKTKTLCPRGASRPRLWSRGLHHWHIPKAESVTGHFCWGIRERM